MFSIHEILDLAIQLEKNAESLYRQAAEQHSDPGISELLTWMAEEEQKHISWFHYQRQKGTINLESELADEMGRGLLMDMVKTQQFSLANTDLASVADKGEMIDIFAEFETDTILFYNLLMPFVTDQHSQEGLKCIIAEEERHHRELKQILDKNSATVNA
jgi:rubrerythrin